MLTPQEHLKGHQLIMVNFWLAVWEYRFICRVCLWYINVLRYAKDILSTRVLAKTSISVICRVCACV